MKVIAWVSDNKRREWKLAEAIVAGVRLCGEHADVQVKPVGQQTPVLDCDFVCFVGVKNRDNFRRYKEAGINYGYFDKGYIRRLNEETEKGGEWLTYWRVSVNGHQPLPFIAKAKRSIARAKEAGLEFAPWRQNGDAILLDGSSAKHYSFAEYGDPTKVAKDLVKDLQKFGRPIIYRPKPSWHDAVPIAGTEFSGGKDFRTAFARSHVLVTYGSNLCFDAMLAGLPSIVLGEGVAKPICSTSIADVEHPRLASDAERAQWLANVAWCQFKLEEFRDGTAWKTIREMIECAAT